MEPWFSVKPERTVSSWDHFIRGIVNKLLNVCPDQPQLNTVFTCGGSNNKNEDHNTCNCTQVVFLSKSKTYIHSTFI